MTIKQKSIVKVFCLFMTVGFIFTGYATACETQREAVRAAKKALDDLKGWKQYNTSQIVGNVVDRLQYQIKKTNPRNTDPAGEIKRDLSLTQTLGSRNDLNSRISQAETAYSNALSALADCERSKEMTGMCGHTYKVKDGIFHNWMTGSCGHSYYKCLSYMGGHDRVTCSKCNVAFYPCTNGSCMAGGSHYVW